MSVLRSPHGRRLSRLKTNSTAAASAIALILITVAVSFVTFMLITPPHTTSRMLHLFQIPVVNSMAMVAFATLSFGYGAGIIAWLGLFAAHRAGVHRLALAGTVRPRPVLKG